MGDVCVCSRCGDVSMCGCVCVDVRVYEVCGCVVRWGHV